MSYEKPKSLLKDVKQQRIRPKSPWLRRLETKQKEAKERSAANVTVLRRRDAR